MVRLSVAAVVMALAALAPKVPSVTFHKDVRKDADPQKVMISKYQQVAGGD